MVRQNVWGGKATPKHMKFMGEALSDESKSLIRNALSDHIVFSNLDVSSQDTVMNAMVKAEFKAGEVIIQEGATGDKFYTVESGKLNVYQSLEQYSKESDKEPTGEAGEHGFKVRHIEKGECFGDLAIFYDRPRNATVKCETDIILWALDMVTFRQALAFVDSQNMLSISNFLSEIPIFASLSPEQLGELATKADFAHFNSGQTVLDETSDTDSLYLVQEGDVTVTAQNSAGVKRSAKRMRIVSTGGVLNESILYSDDPPVSISYTRYASGRTLTLIYNHTSYSHLL